MCVDGLFSKIWSLVHNNARADHEVFKIFKILLVSHNLINKHVVIGTWILCFYLMMLHARPHGTDR